MCWLFGLWMVDVDFVFLYVFDYFFDWYVCVDYDFEIVVWNVFEIFVVEEGVEVFVNFVGECVVCWD